MPSLASISHKHFRAMQGRKLCLAVPTPTPHHPSSLKTESSISVPKPY